MSKPSRLKVEECIHDTNEFVSLEAKESLPFNEVPAALPSTRGATAGEYFPDFPDDRRDIARSMPVSFVEPRHFGLTAGAEPVRKIAPRTGRLSMPGTFPTLKGTLPALRVETQLELDGLQLYEIDPDVVLMATQPHHLLYFDVLPDGSSVRRTYTPDLAVQTSDGSIVVVDFKVAKYAHRPEWRRKEALFKHHYRVDHGATFMTVTDAMVRVEPRFGNAKLMLLHWSRRSDVEAQTAMAAVIETVGLPARLGDLTRRCQITNPRPDVDRAFTAMIAMAFRGEVELDLGVPIGPETIVSIKTRRRGVAA
jgi:hypothetical protein